LKRNYPTEKKERNVMAITVVKSEGVYIENELM